VRAWRVGGGVELVELDVLHQAERVLELLLRLAREAHDDVGGDGGVGQPGEDEAGEGEDEG